MLRPTAPLGAPRPASPRCRLTHSKTSPPECAYSQRVLTGLPQMLQGEELPNLVLFEHIHLRKQQLSAIDVVLAAAGYHFLGDLSYVLDQHSPKYCRCGPKREPCTCPNVPANRLYGRPRM